MKPSKHSPRLDLEFSKNPHQNRLTSLFFTLMASVALLALSTISASAQTSTNYLANPGFELGTSGWTIVPPWTWNGPSYAVDNTNTWVYGSGDTIKVDVHGGTNTLKIWGYFQPYTTTPGVMQTFPASPDSQWAASGWVSTQVPDNIQTNSSGVSETAYLQVLFLDATTNYNVPLASYTSPAIDIHSPTTTWLELAVNDGSSNTNLTAPFGTAFVRLQLIFSQPDGYPGGSSYWDDVQLVSVSKPDPEITAQPVPLTRVYGQTATFSVVADGQTTLSYYWQKDGADITDPNAYGTNTATLTLSNLTTAAIGNYAVTVTDSAGSLTSDSAYLTVLDPGVLSITPPVGQTATNGGTAIFTVDAAGSSALTYQWRLNDVDLSDGGRISGATSPTLTVANLIADDAGTYSVWINYGSAIASTLLKVVSSSQLETNLLVNPGFEDGVFSEPWESGWVPFNGALLATTNDYYYLTTEPVSVYDGDYVCRTYASNPDNGLYQVNVPAVVGATYRAGGQFYVSSLDPMTGAAWTVLQVMFKNGSGGTISTFATSQIGTNFTTDAWTSLQVSNAVAGGLDLVAPAGTASITCQVYEYAQQGGGGSVYFDDLYVTQASQAPPAAVTITPWEDGGSMYLAFPTTAGVTYEVLYAGGLTSAGSWQTNTTVAGDGTVKTVSDPIGAGPRFYRVLAHY